MAQGNIIVFTTTIPTLARPKTIRVYVPAGAGPESPRRLLVMQDGHNLFDPSTSAFGTSWNIHRILDRSAASGIEVPIVAGVDCPSPSRFDEYSPWRSPNASLLKPDLGPTVHGGEGDRYVDWLADDLIPTLTSRFPIRSGGVGIAGSSMGGLLALYAACARPDVFDIVGAFSPAVWFAPDELLACLATRFPTTASAYLDIGTNETSNPADPQFPARYLSGARAVRDVLRKRGVDRLKYVEEEGALHHESAWERRFPGFLSWFLES